MVRPMPQPGAIRPAAQAEGVEGLARLQGWPVVEEMVETRWAEATLIPSAVSAAVCCFPVLAVAVAVAVAILTLEEWDFLGNQVALISSS